MHGYRQRTLLREWPTSCTDHCQLHPLCSEPAALQGFSSVVPLPASQAQGPEFDPQYRKTKRQSLQLKGVSSLRHTTMKNNKHMEFKSQPRRLLVPALLFSCMATAPKPPPKRLLHVQSALSSPGKARPVAHRSQMRALPACLAAGAVCIAGVRLLDPHWELEAGEERLQDQRSRFLGRFPEVFMVVGLVVLPGSRSGLCPESWKEVRDCTTRTHPERVCYHLPGVSSPDEADGQD
ncbi:uncharacterized protein LOC117287047 [Fukomys damarensis]|uniref:uncharacterized protein LOC117287047 n=1 Tax=Fukomys damarensis TaxID=885580 RepID=UPI0014556B5D|nr:uncharacterized protein LOC117287047 [Fukomys damarensis]